MISLSLFYKKRRKLINCFIIILSLHDVKMKNIIIILKNIFATVNAKCSLFINDNNEEINLYVFSFMLLKNMF